MADKRVDNVEPRDNSEQVAKETGERLLNSAQPDKADGGDKNVPQSERMTAQALAGISEFIEQMKTPEGQQAYLNQLRQLPVEALQKMVKESDEAHPKVARTIVGLESMLNEAKTRV